MAEPHYQRLTRSRARQGLSIAFSRCSLWLAQDHLLSLESTGYSETYKRFYFRDIQAITVTQTPWWMLWGIALGAIAAAFGSIALFSGQIVAAYIFGPLAGLFFFAMLYDFVAGPSCSCELRTAVQTERLASLNRVPRALKALARVRPLITAAQGELNPADIAEISPPSPAPSDSPLPAAVAAESPVASPESVAPEPQPPSSASDELTTA